MSKTNQQLKTIEEVENIIFNVIDSAGYKEETFFEFQRVDDNKTVFKMKFVELPGYLVKQALEYANDIVEGKLIVYPLNDKTIELRVY